MPVVIDLENNQIVPAEVIPLGFNRDQQKVIAIAALGFFSDQVALCIPPFDQVLPGGEMLYLENDADGRGGVGVAQLTRPESSDENWFSLPCWNRLFSSATKRNADDFQVILPGSDNPVRITAGYEPYSTLIK